MIRHWSLVIGHWSLVICHLVGAGLVRFGCNRNDSCQTRPYNCHHIASLSP
ncbi:hypothetical protein [Coleofasciculus sp. E1-EBD-02]|uniref:hypothetical protein n=1 Tax=Coleofasciculus sp. E1-EBD-02 TaxID=3068481 RepID=UPI0033004322